MAFSKRAICQFCVCNRFMFLPNCRMIFTIKKKLVNIFIHLIIIDMFSVIHLKCITDIMYTWNRLNAGNANRLIFMLLLNG